MPYRTKISRDGTTESVYPWIDTRNGYNPVSTFLYKCNRLCSSCSFHPLILVFCHQTIWVSSQTQRNQENVLLESTFRALDGIVRKWCFAASFPFQRNDTSSKIGHRACANFAFVHLTHATRGDKSPKVCCVYYHYVYQIAFLDTRQNLN